MSSFSARYDPGVQVSGGDVLSLHRNENLFVGPDWTVQAASDLAARARVATYPDATCAALREALAELYGVGPDNVFVGNGSDEVLADLLHALRRSHATLHALDVGFKVYPMLAERLEYRLAVLPGRTFETGHIEPTGFCGLAVVDCPNGISGTSVPHDELLALADDPESFLIWDNAYGEYAGDRAPVPLRPNLAFVRSFSKFYALAGLRVGYCLADAGLVSELMARKDVFNVNALAQVMALEALARREHFEALREALSSCRAELVRGLEELGFRVRPSQSVAVLATHPDLSARRLQQELLARGIAVRHFPDPPIADFVRVTVAPPPDLERFLDATRRIVAGGS